MFLVKVIKISILRHRVTSINNKTPQEALRVNEMVAVSYPPRPTDYFVNRKRRYERYIGRIIDLISPLAKGKEG